MMDYTQTLAEKVVELCGEVDAFSLYSGYGVKADKIIRFPQGVCQRETRNKKGLLTMSRYEYADGSVLTYRRKNDNSYSLKAERREAFRLWLT